MSGQTKTRQGGVLPVTAAATKKPATTQKPAQRPPAPKLRLLIRRLPPGLVESEFWQALGSEWQVGQGSVEWFAFKTGKVSKDPSKPSRPARAYLKVKDQSILEVLSARVKQTQFRDAKNSTSDPCLVGPPSLEFAPYSKTPGGRVRNDGRQGIIDQDPEFIDFLQSLTEPITKSVVNGGDAVDGKTEKITTTPLVQYIKEKKANKAKEKEAATAAKNSKKVQEAKEAKSKGDSKPTVIIKSTSSSAEKARPGKSSQEAVKPSTKLAVTSQSKAAATKPESKPKELVSATPPAAKRERERGNASAAVRMISRDLGLTPKEPRQPRTSKNSGNGTKESATDTNATKPEPKKSPQISEPKPSVTPVPTTASETKPLPTAPRSSRPAQSQQPKQQPQGSQKQQQQQKPAAQPSSGAKSAFLKHANTSQGINDEALRAVFGGYGEITRCEVDRKKGLAYIDFTEPEALKKAMAASPIKVANGQVTVLENRSPYRKGGQQRPNEGSAGPQIQPSTANPAANARASKVAVEPTTALPSADAVSVGDQPSIGLPVEDTPNEKVNIDSSSSQASAEGSSTTPRGPKGNTNPTRGGRGQNANSVKNGGANRGGGGGGGGGGRGGHRSVKSRGGKGSAAPNATGTQPTVQASAAADHVNSSTTDS